ncbi:hypothetical protein A2U01_0097285, partial [Trifolium medium]|nr:hypothetical protein [Trifolium medium]
TRGAEAHVTDVEALEGGTLGRANHVEGGAHGRAELAKLKV